MLLSATTATNQTQKQLISDATMTDLAAESAMHCHPETDGESALTSADLSDILNLQSML